MPVISENSESLALINTFQIHPDKAKALIELLDEATVDVMRHIDGFISANIHQSLDGKYVTNYAQWRDKAAFDAMLKNDTARLHMKRAAELCESYSPILYTVKSCHE